MVDLQASQLIAQDLVPRATTLPGVLGLVPEAQAFVSAWQDLTQQPARLAFELRMHQLQTVQPIRPTPGHLRPATESDRPLLIQWNHDFMMEAFGTLEEDPAQTAAYQLSQKRIYIWQDQEPVAMINSRVSTPHGATIAPVYTPPKHRRQGYATAAVAALSQQLLDQGYRYCFLFTDLANPTSNHIYQLVGYQAIADCRSYSLVDD
jgi:predicted GNAT family acetyltransferase